jgi:hypothetical protein
MKLDTQVLKDIQNVIALLRKVLKNRKDRIWANLRKSTPSPRQRGISLLLRYLLKKIFFHLKNKMIYNHKNLNNPNRYIIFYSSGKQFIIKILFSFFI